MSLRFRLWEKLGEGYSLLLKYTATRCKRAEPTVRVRTGVRNRMVKKQCSVSCIKAGAKF